MLRDFDRRLPCFSTALRSVDNWGKGAWYTPLVHAQISRASRQFREPRQAIRERLG